MNYKIYIENDKKSIYLNISGTVTEIVNGKTIERELNIEDIKTLQIGVARSFQNLSDFIIGPNDFRK